ncbi:MAG: hypothetical protein HQL87_18395 [Magnetococcales bacterium]|nr:hypothetical protein [Magnetococcales bacterium]
MEAKKQGNRISNLSQQDWDFPWDCGRFARNRIVNSRLFGKKGERDARDPRIKHREPSNAIALGDT